MIIDTNIYINVYGYDGVFVEVGRSLDLCYQSSIYASRIVGANMTAIEQKYL